MSATEPSSVLPLFAWLSPAYPVGGFAYSHGLESAADAGLVGDAETTRGWILDLFDHGSVRQDAVLASASWRSAGSSDLADINDLALALAPSRERRLETGAMGRAFVEASRAAWPHALSPALPQDGDIAYPVAFGSASGMLRLPLGLSLEAFALAFASTLVSAALRLGVVGQSDAQRIIARLAEPARELGRWASTTSLDDLGACAWRSDIAALHHETLYSRLFRS